MQRVAELRRARPTAAVGQHQDQGPGGPDTLYVHGLAAPFTINTMPDVTLQAFYEHGEVGEPMPADGDDCDAMLARFGDAGVDVAELAAKLQADGRSRSSRPGTT